MGITFNVYDLQLELNCSEKFAIKLAKELLDNGITRKIGTMHYEVIGCAEDGDLYEQETKFFSILRESLKIINNEND